MSPKGFNYKINETMPSTNLSTRVYRPNRTEQRRGHVLGRDSVVDNSRHSITTPMFLSRPDCTGH